VQLREGAPGFVGQRGDEHQVARQHESRREHGTTRPPTSDEDDHTVRARDDEDEIKVMSTDRGVRNQPIADKDDRQQQQSEHREPACCESVVAQLQLAIRTTREDHVARPLALAPHSSMPRRIASATAAARSLTPSFS
jgi:hypothetical protein